MLSQLAETAVNSLEMNTASRRASKSVPPQPQINKTGHSGAQSPSGKDQELQGPDLATSTGPLSVRSNRAAQATSQWAALRLASLEEPLPVAGAEPGGSHLYTSRSHRRDKERGGPLGARTTHH